MLGSLVRIFSMPASCSRGAFFPALPLLRLTTGLRIYCPYYLDSFRILVTSESSGLMETVTDAVSIHSIKKEAYSRFVHDGKIVTYSLFDHYVNVSLAFTQRILLVLVTFDELRESSCTD